MEAGGNILTLGDNLQNTIEEVQKYIPTGLEINQVSNQPQVVKDSIDEFVGSCEKQLSSYWQSVF
mgnify:FL=1